MVCACSCHFIGLQLDRIGCIDWKRFHACLASHGLGLGSQFSTFPQICERRPTCRPCAGIRSAAHPQCVTANQHEAAARRAPAQPLPRVTRQLIWNRLLLEH